MNTGGESESGRGTIITGNNSGGSSIVSDSNHFSRNTYSRMRVDLAIQLFGRNTIVDTVNNMDQ